MAAHARRSRRAELGQHFLERGALAADIVARAPVRVGDLVIEIGPGTGALTRELARRGAHVRAIELDPVLAARLRSDFAATPLVEVVEGDFLAAPLPGEPGFAPWPGAAGRGAEPYVVIGNIPFGRTAEIVRRLLGSRRPPRDALLIVQREAARRFAGAPYAPESLQSVLLKPWWHVEIARSLPARVFTPPPAVDGALLWLAHRPRPLVDGASAERYRRFITTTFGRRGRAAGAALAGTFTRAQLQRMGDDLHFDPRPAGGDTPSALSFDQWLALFRAAERLGRRRGMADHGARSRC